MASIFPGKKADQIKLKWLSILRTNLSKAPWSTTEDQILIEVMKKKTDKMPWRDVAAEVNQRAGNEFLRTGKQCSERWTNHLDPNVNRGAWTEEEDIKLFRCFLQTGKKWSELSKMIENRTENAVKNRFNSLMKKFQKDETLLASTKHENDEQHLKKLAALVLSQNRLGNSSHIMKEYETKQENVPLSTISERSSGKMSIETAAESILSKKKDPDPPSGTLRPGHSRQPSRVDQKKNLLKSMIQQEPQAGFPTSQQQNITMAIEQPQLNTMPVLNLGVGFQTGINNPQFATPLAGNVNNARSNMESFGKNPNFFPQQNQQMNNQQTLSQMNLNGKLDMLRAANNQSSLPNIYGGGGLNNYLPNNQGAGVMEMNNMMNNMQTHSNQPLANQQQETFGSNQLVNGVNFGYFPNNPLGGLSYLSGTMPQNNDFSQSLGQNSILGSTNAGLLPMSSPMLRSGNNPFMGAQNIQQMDTNQYNNKSNFSSEERKQNLSQEGPLPTQHIENPIGTHQAKPTTEIKRELTQKNLNEFNPETVIKPNSNKIMFAVIDNEKGVIYPINPVTFETYKSVMNVTKLSQGRDSLFASPLSFASDLANSNLIGNPMDVDNVTKLKSDYNSSLAYHKQIMAAQGSPSLGYFNSLFTGRKPDGSPDSFLCLRSPTLLGGSLGRRPNSNQMMDQSPPIFFKP